MRKTHFLGLAILAALPGAGAEAREPADGRPIPVAVSVFNDARIPPAVLEAAGIRARRVLENAGMALTWLDCGSPGDRRGDAGCTAISFPSHLSVRLVKGASPVSEDTFGQSVLDDRGQGSYAYVYAGAVAGSRFANVVDEGDLLGYVVAHEIGHLLLGRASHSATGLMCAVWQAGELGQAAKGNLYFTAREREKIRSRYFLAVARQETVRPRTDTGR
jgi:hypothetical protein